MPWIGHGSPWAIFVSEVMLQQTQTFRVIEPWKNFLEAFPTPVDCAKAPLSRVIKLWSGLGFNRRAKNLHEAAKVMVRDFGGEVPRGVHELKSLPGIGDYTAHAVASFAFGEKVAVLDTNVGRVLARALANRTLSVKEAKSLADDVLDRRQPAKWNQSMLDLGAQFCKASPLCEECPVNAVCLFYRSGGDDPAPKSGGVSKPQSKFEGSDRQVRGQILKALGQDEIVSSTAMRRKFAHVDTVRYEAILESLVIDGLVGRTARSLKLVD